MAYFYLKAFHLVFAFTWFAGLFATMRLLGIHASLKEKDETERSTVQTYFKNLEKRLWIILAWPSMILTLILGFTMIGMRPELMSQPWMHIKLTLLILFVVYHIICHTFYKRYQNDEYKHEAKKIRILNEMAMLFIVLIILSVVIGRVSMGG